METNKMQNCPNSHGKGRGVGWRTRLKQDGEQTYVHLLAVRFGAPTMDRNMYCTVL